MGIFFGTILFGLSIWLILQGAGVIDAQNNNWYDVHHYYLGILLLAIGTLIGSLLFSFDLLILGSLLCIDDLWQHWKHARGDIMYRSPIHRLYGKYLYDKIRSFMYRIGLGQFFDRF